MPISRSCDFFKVFFQNISKSILFLDEDSMTSQMVSCSGPAMDMFYVIMATTVWGRHRATMTTDSRHLSEGIRICFSCPIGKNGFISAQRCPICLCVVIILAKLLGKPSDPTVFSR